MKRIFVMLCLLSCNPWLYGQGAGPYAGGNDGVDAQDPLFEGWITHVVSQTQPDPLSGGFARNDAGAFVSTEAAIVGRPGTFAVTGNVSHVASLGNGGSLTVGFAAAITDGPGPDFAVFENAFVDVAEPFVFAELAFVEVGTTTSHWARFENTFLSTNIVYDLNNIENDWYASQDVTLIDGLAGKHVIDQGTPFDLNTLTNHPAVTNGLVDLQDIRYVRLTDVVGDGSTLDSQGRPIYDPYYHALFGFPTAASPLSTDGFDLRGIGVIHHQVKLETATNGFNWMAFTNAAYQVQYRTDWAQAWSNAGPVAVGTNGPMSYTFGNETFQVYRVVKTK